MYKFGLWFEGGDNLPAEWLKDKSGRVLLFTEEGGQAMRDALQIGPEQIILKPYDGDGPTMERNLDAAAIAALAQT